MIELCAEEGEEMGWDFGDQPAVPTTIMVSRISLVGLGAP